MVFELTENLCEYPTDKEEDILICITNLLVGYYEGNHLLMATESICDFFQPKITDSRAYSALNYLKNHCSYGYDVNWSVKIVINEQRENQLELSLFFFKSTASIQPVYILGEHTQDIDFFIRITKLYFPDYNINCIPQNGGGSDTAKNFKRIQKLDSFCLVIIDTDRKYPDDDFGDTHKEVIKVYRKSLKNIRVYPLNVHEIENLLPISFLCNITNKEGKLFLNKFQKDGTKDLFRYYDIKQGITLDCIENNELYYKYAEQIYNLLYKSKKCNFAKFISEMKRNGKTKVFPGIRKDALKKYMENKNPDNSINYFNDEWIKIAKEIVTFTCSRESTPIS